MSDGRARAWTFIVYPGDIRDDWREQLDMLHIEWVESPYHCFDLNPTGEEKKPHIHILALFTNVKSYDQIEGMCRDSFGTADTGSIKGCTYPQKCHNVKSLVRYFMHWDNPEKHQYSVTELKCHGGANVDDYLVPSASERYEIISDIEEFITNNLITEFQDIADIARREHYVSPVHLLLYSHIYVHFDLRLKVLIMSDEFKITLYKWLINSEWHIHNELISIRNDFDRRSFHNLQDCYNLLRAEQRYNDFKAFSGDLEKLLQLPI